MAMYGDCWQQPARCLLNNNYFGTPGPSPKPNLSPEYVLVDLHMTHKVVHKLRLVGGWVGLVGLLVRARKQNQVYVREATNVEPP